ncbi:MAG: histidine triad nucleotide-binding protein [Chloroflexi bacterium]|nr:histidine triad nucleotide-binding protein [Chloroflexota bacterium]
MANQDCVFCKIVAGELPSNQVYQDDLVTAFRDNHPLAPTHILIVPNEHLINANDLNRDHADVAARMLTIIPEIAKKEGVAESGYRLIMNAGPDGNQVVMHMHMHLLAGHRMRHPMG